jgi:hypothetical protein
MSIQKINIENIVLSTHIVKAILNYDSNRKINNQVIYDGSLPLNRMTSIMECNNFDNLLNIEPIQLKLDYIDNNQKKFYRIINGRHRIARAILEDIKEINSIILI